MHYDAPNPAEIRPRPRRRWFQYRLRTLLLLPAVVGLLLVLYLYWDEWRKQRPPYKNHDMKEYFAACDEFFDDLAAGRLDHAYELTSARFKKQMSRSEFETTVGRFLALPQIEQGVGARLSAPMWSSHHLPDRNWSYRSDVAKGPEGKVTELVIWALTDVNDDSFFYRRPPPPRIEEIQVQEFCEKEWESDDVPDPKATWERE